MLRREKRASVKDILKVITGILLIVVSGCMPDAKRDNPFDPKSEGYSDEGRLTGRVTRIYRPSEGIEGVTVSLNPPGSSSLTDGDGFYTIDNIPSGTIEVIARKSGYAQDSMTVEIVAGQSHAANFSLDGLPYFLDIRIGSEHDRPSPSDDRYFFHFEAQVNDPDGLSDIDSAVVRVEALGFRKELILIPNTNRFSLTVSAEEIAGESLEALVGKEVVFSAWDRIGLRSDAPPEHLVRIIHPSPSTVTPSEQEVVDSQPLLVWAAFSAPFTFTYTVDVKNAFSSGWHREGIPPDTTSVTVSDPLDSRWSHYWAVWVVDEFGNISKSPYVTFWVGGER
ncbi:MAG: carboxypeptidase-like regulatory domain-containing protein [bacterium]